LIAGIYIKTFKLEIHKYRHFSTLQLANLLVGSIFNEEELDSIELSYEIEKSFIKKKF